MTSVMARLPKHLRKPPKKGTPERELYDGVVSEVRRLASTPGALAQLLADDEDLKAAGFKIRVIGK